MIGIFRHHDMRDQPLGRQPAFDQPRRRLHHRFLAGAAGVFRAARDDHLVLPHGSRSYGRAARGWHHRRCKQAMEPTYAAAQ
jgi:hypothetical protein